MELTHKLVIAPWNGYLDGEGLIGRLARWRDWREKERRDWITLWQLRDSRLSIVGKVAGKTQLWSRRIDRERDSASAGMFTRARLRLTAVITVFTGILFRDATRREETSTSVFLSSSNLRNGEPRAFHRSGDRVTQLPDGSNIYYQWKESDVITPAFIREMDGRSRSIRFPSVKHSLFIEIGKD